MMMCKICDRGFKGFASLSKHIKMHNISPEEYYKQYLLVGDGGCKECGSTTTFKSLSSGYKPFCCLKCAYKYRTGKKRIAKEEPERNIECKICNKKLISMKALACHIRPHNISSQEYYNKYLLKDINEKKCSYCQQETKFLSLTSGYQKYCSSKCCNSEKNKRENNKLRMKEHWSSPENSKNTKEKISETIKNLWRDKTSAFHDKDFRKKLSQSQIDRWKDYRKKFADICAERTDFVLSSSYNSATSEIAVKCTKCNHKFETTWNLLQYRKNCPKCYKNGISEQEKQIVDFIKSILSNIKIIENSRALITPKEVDIYIPSHNIAIEYNGLWSHSEECEWGGKDSQYHLNKTVECAKKGVQLIHIFEDEWIFKKEIVKNRLKNILNASNKERVYARKCEIKEISSKDKNDFLNKFHIQGKDSSIIKLAAFYNNEIVSIMTFSKGNIAKGSIALDDIWELNRFCTNYNYIVIGIASKLLTYFKRNYEWKQIFSYADRRWSKGDLYYKLGFQLDRITDPNYWYIKNCQRVHRFSLRKSINNENNLPEAVIRKKQGYGKIWDCGNLKFSILKEE